MGLVDLVKITEALPETVFFQFVIYKDGSGAAWISDFESDGVIAVHQWEYLFEAEQAINDLLVHLQPVINQQHIEDTIDL